MGLIISRFRRKKTTTEILERLETNIKSIEEDDQFKEKSHKRVMGYVMAYSVGLYVVFAVLYYFMYVGRSQYWLHSALHASPLLVLPVLVIFLRSAISWYYSWTLNKNRIKLNKMREEKKKILEEVMNTETYKVAKQILDKFGSPDEHSRALKPYVPAVSVPGNDSSPRIVPLTPLAATPGQLRQRQFALAASSPPCTSTPNNNHVTSALALNNASLGYKVPRLRSDQLPRPLLDKNRSALDKVVDYLLKDGPNQRMALICSQCSSHNGMAMMEEFEFVSYACAYCGHANPARRQRPYAPPLVSGRAITYARATPAHHQDADAGEESPLVSSPSSSPSPSDTDEEVVDSANKHSGSDGGSERTVRPPADTPYTPAPHETRD